MELFAESLARCGRLTRAGIETVAHVAGPQLPAGVLAHPDLTLTPAVLAAVDADQLQRLGELGVEDSVLRQVLTAVPWTVVADCLVHPSGAALDVLVSPALAGHEEAAWLVLRDGPGQHREQLLHLLASRVTTASTTQRWTWLAAAVQCPHLLRELSQRVGPELVPTLTRYAAAAAAGVDVAELFAHEALDTLDGNATPDWSATRPARRLSAVAAVRSTGLAAIATGVLGAVDARNHPRVCQEVIAHPHLVGSAPARAARASLEQRLAAVAGPGAVHVPGALDLVPEDSWLPVVDWVSTGHDSPQQLAVAWDIVRNQVELPDRGARGRIAAAVLMCADQLDGDVWQAAHEWLRQNDGQRTIEDEWTRLLQDLGEQIHLGAGLAAVPVASLRALWSWLGGASWLSRVVGDYLSTVPAVGDPAFVHALLGMSETFSGSLGDLVAIAAGIAS